MKRLVINARFLTQKTTGTQRFATEISRELKKANPDILFVAPVGIIHKQLAEELEVKVIGRLRGALWEQIELPKYLFSIGSPLLLNFVNAAPLVYSNQIVTLHDLAFKRNPSWFSLSFRAYYNFLIPRILKRAKKILTVSEFSKKEIYTFFKIPESKIDVIPNAVGQFFRPVPVESSLEASPFILGVSSIEPRKNFRNLIKAFSLIRNKEVKLVIVGAGGRAFANLDLEKQIQDNPNIVFTGYVDDARLLKLYNEAKAFIYPSLYEGFGIPPLEAMACGCPTIVSRSSSIPEVCGDASIYFDPENVTELANKIDDLLADPDLQKQLSLKGLSRARHFSWSDSSGKVLTIVDSL